MARSEMAAETNLTRAAMSLIFNDLVNDKIVVERGKRRRAAGRKPVLLQLRPEYGHSIGLYLSRTQTSIAVVDLLGNTINKSPIDISGLPRTLAISLIGKAVARALKIGHGHGRFLGLGISTPGPVDYATGTILNPINFDQWHGVRFATEFQSLCGERIFVDNTATALTLAEKAYGAGREFDSFLLLSIRSGVGAGIVQHNELFRGWHGFGSEVGHTSVDFNGPRCGCGLNGCLEVYASIPAVLENVRKLGGNVSSWADFVDRLASGDPICKQAAERQASVVGTAVVSILNVMELDAVVMTGEILRGGEMLRASVEKFVNTTAINRRLRHIPVRLSRFDDDAGCRAAAAIVSEKFFQGELK